MTLFEPDAPAVPRPLSYGQRVTLRNRQLLAAGRHPATRHPLFIGTGETCGTCAHHVAWQHNTRTYHKCTLHRLGPSASEASDIRVSWPACALYIAEEDQ